MAPTLRQRIWLLRFRGLTVMFVLFVGIFGAIRRSQAEYRPIVWASPSNGTMVAVSGTEQP